MSDEFKVMVSQARGKLAWQERAEKAEAKLALAEADEGQARLQRMEKAWNDLLYEKKDLLVRFERLKETLEEISKGEGVYSLDQLQHARNTIEAMKRLADEALEEA